MGLGEANRKKGRRSGVGGGKAHLGATVDGLSEPDVLLGLGASEPVLLGDALGVGVDAGLTGGEVAEDLDGVVHAALVGVDPVESCQEKQEKKPSKCCTADISPAFMESSRPV